METFIVLSRKGGTGKTTTAHALGAGLMKQGQRVLFIDMDGQANLTLTFGADENAASAYDLLRGEAEAPDIIQQMDLGDIIPGNEMLHVCERYLKGENDIYILSDALKKVARKYDYCVIDTPAALGMVTLNCIIAADRIIVPVQADLYSAQGVMRIHDTLKTVNEKSKTKHTIDGLLLTRHNPRTTISKSILKDLQDIAARYRTRVYNTTIRECAALKEAALMQQSIFDYAPRSNGAKDYAEFIAEFVG